MSTNSLSTRAQRLLAPPLYVVTATLLTFGLLPLLFWLAAWAEAARAARYLGYWPTYSNPDPKDLPAHYLPALAWIEWAVPLGAWATLMAGGFWLLHRTLPRRAWPLASALTIPILWLFVGIILSFVPYDPLEWILD